MDQFIAMALYSMVEFDKVRKGRKKKNLFFLSIAMNWSKSTC
jgi:hypothetical protein